jgi:hypothetical protein
MRYQISTLTIQSKQFLISNKLEQQRLNSCTFLMEFGDQLH